MKLEWRLFGVLATLLAAVCVAGWLSTYDGDRRERHRDDAFLSGLLSQAWQRASLQAEADLRAVQNDGLLPAVARALCASDVHTALDKWNATHAGWRLELADSSGNLLYSNANAVDAPSMVGGMSMSMREPSQQPSPASTPYEPVRFDVLGPGAYAWVSILRFSEACRSSNARYVLIGRDVTPALMSLSAGLGGKVTLQALGLPAILFPPVLRAANGRFQRVVIPLKGSEGSDARPVANLVWLPDMTDPAGNTSFIDTGSASSGALWLANAAGLGLMLMFLYVSLRAISAPLQRSMQAFNRLLMGDYVLSLDDEDNARRDQAGQMARGVSQLRTDLLNLRMLQEERERGAQEQGRLIREPLLKLARGLDDSDRQDISAWLDRLDWQGQESRSPLADLAGVLERLTLLVSAHHQKRLRALHELALASQRDAQFAALQQELDIASQMQRAILPTNQPGWHGLNLAATIIPAKEVGGDFYDYFLLDDTHLAMVIADVSGKGVPAAFFMAIARTLLKSLVNLSIPPAQTITRLNDLLCEENPQCMFVTLFYGVLDLRTGALRYVNAGHNPPLIAPSGDTAVRKLASARNPALGVVEAHAYCGDTAELREGDVLFLYTDGFSEAQNEAQALFGDAALVAALSSVVHDMASRERPELPGVPMVPDATQVNNGVIALVRTFEHGTAQADDMTCLALRYASLDAMQIVASEPNQANAHDTTIVSNAQVQGHR